jgi:pimeloyl-ACP methyl ester carboxylesterase
VDAPAPRGSLVDIGGRRLHAVRAGPTSVPGPLVVLEAGSFGFSADWAVVQQRLAARTVASIAYDRAGLGRSDPAPGLRDSHAIAQDLEALLAAVGETGLLVHVGHSMAGLHAHAFAARNRARIAGLVLVDALTPGAAADPDAVRMAAYYARFSRAVAWAARSGVLRPLARYADAIGLTPDAAQDKRRTFADPAHNQAAAAEVAVWPMDLEEAKAAGPLDPAWPVAVVTAGPGRSGTPRRTLMAEPGRASQAGHVAHVPKANHASLLGRRHADAVVDAILHVRDRVSRT